MAPGTLHDGPPASQDRGTCAESSLARAQGSRRVSWRHQPTGVIGFARDPDSTSSGCPCAARADLQIFPYPRKVNRETHGVRRSNWPVEARLELMEPRSWNSDLPGTYDRVARPYADQFFTELERKPFDRGLLDRFAECMRGRGCVCDLGCGPGHVGRYLRGRGVAVFGRDLSPAMVALARELNPTMRFEQGDMRALSLAADSLAGIVAFYSLIHLERPETEGALRELARVLVSGGLLLLAFHGGEGTVHADDWFGRGVSVDATLSRPAEMTPYMEAAGFAVEAITTRPPYEFEYQTPRVYASGVKR